MANMMELHRMLMFLGVVLLVATFAAFYSGDASDDEIGIAHVTGIAMLAVFMASLALFNRNRWDRPRK